VQSNASENLGISGRIAKSFLTTEITPLLAIVGLLLGLFAALVTPREEEPQINVTFANVMIPFPGASVAEVESLLTTSAEQVVSEISGVKNIYSVSSPGMAMLTVRFEVGEPRTDAIVRLYNAFYSNRDIFPANMGIGEPVIKPKGIDDVPVLAATLWSRDDAVSSADLLNVAHTIQSELQRVEGTRDITVIGGANRAIQINFDPVKMAALSVTLDDVRAKLQYANVTTDSGDRVKGNSAIRVQAGQLLQDVSEVKNLVITVRHGAPVYLRDIADIYDAPEQPNQYVSFGTGSASSIQSPLTPAVTIAIAKKPGENAVEVADALIDRFEAIQGVYVPDNIETTITRNYGETADDKAQTLIKKLIFATLSVIVLVLFALGVREAIVVGIAVIVTLAITLFASWAWGFTLNRVSLFALIFSIGILVDDAIVVVENIHRHMSMGVKSLREAIPLAVDEVGGPTILATFTVIAALLPMAFVSGLMGPYMLPIPINASTGMLISLAVAFILTPWLFLKLFRRHVETGHSADHGHSETRFKGLFVSLLSPMLRQGKGALNRYLLLFSILAMIGGSVYLVVNQSVILKMLPFDNKSEFQVIVDMPEGTSLEQTQRVLTELAEDLQALPELKDFQIYSGSASPINFNGLVRQYYLRSAPHQGDIQVNLSDKSLRDRKSHDIALEARTLLADTAERFNANVKVVEMPPGPPVMAPLVAEIYGLDKQGQIEVAQQVRKRFENTDGVVDVDDSIEAQQHKEIFAIDRVRAAHFGVADAAIVSALNSAIRGESLGYLHDDYSRVPVPLTLKLSEQDKANIAKIESIQVRSEKGTLVSLADVTRRIDTQAEQSIYHKDLLPVVYVTGDVAGNTDSPLYGLFEIESKLDEVAPSGNPIDRFFFSEPSDPYEWSLKWDGEWQITFETFRDMGIAYSVGLIMIYLLVVAQFRSYGIPLIIMAPIPLTIIGIMPGHALLGQQFTAPSMIGMIALAGIIVRNSILLVDFIQQQVREGMNFQEATINAAAVRSLPIALTAVAAMMGGFFIIDDPIFGGLAVSLIFGLMISTILTLVVIPVVYYHYHWKKHA